MRALILSLLCHTVASLFIYIVPPWNDTNSLPPTPDPANLTSIFLDSAYSTAGTYPTHSIITHSMSLLHHSDILEDSCSISARLNVCDTVVVLAQGSHGNENDKSNGVNDKANGELASASDDGTDGLLMADGLPALPACTRHLFGRVPALAVMLQRRGAKALVLPASEQYSEGRVVGFTSAVQIPVVVASKATVEYIVQNAPSVVSIGLPPISNSEAKVLTNLAMSYTACVIVNTVLYGVLVVMMALAVFGEIQRIRRKKKHYSHRIVMTCSSLASAIACFLWLLVDPFGGKENLKWYTSVAYYFHQGIFCIVNVLIVRMWILFTFRKREIINKAVSTVTYIVAPAVLLIALVQGVYWYDSTVLLMFSVSQTSVSVLCGLGYVIFGKNFLVIFSKSGNASPDGKNLPAKIALFVLIYVIGTYTIIVISFVQPLGGIFSTLLITMVSALLFYAIFLFLFFPKLETRKKPIRKITFTHMNEMRASKE